MSSGVMYGDKGHNDKGLGVFLVLFLSVRVCVYTTACVRESSQGAFVEVRGQPAGVASPLIRREVGIKVRLSDCQAWQRASLPAEPTPTT